MQDLNQKPLQNEQTQKQKPPLAYKILAIFSLLLALPLSLFVIIFISYSFGDNSFIYFRDIVLSALLALNGLWLMISTISWFKADKNSYALLLINICNIFFSNLYSFFFPSHIGYTGFIVVPILMTLFFSVPAGILFITMVREKVISYSKTTTENLFPKKIIICYILSLIFFTLSVAYLGRTTPSDTQAGEPETKVLLEKTNWRD